MGALDHVIVALFAICSLHTLSISIDAFIYFQNFNLNKYGNPEKQCKLRLWSFKFLTTSLLSYNIFITVHSKVFKSASREEEWKDAVGCLLFSPDQSFQGFEVGRFQHLFVPPSILPGFESVEKSYKGIFLQCHIISWSF